MTINIKIGSLSVTVTLADTQPLAQIFKAISVVLEAKDGSK